MKKLLTPLAFISALTLPALAQAHPGHDAGSSFASGALHPLTGFDHLLALIAVGLLTTRMGGTALLSIPAAFLTLLATGIALGFAGVQLDYVEPAILVSIVVCALLALWPPRGLPVAATALAALFAVFHGNAHGMEAAAGMGRVSYAAGLLASSVLAIAASAAFASIVTRSATRATSAPRH
jgi:urease accessory protein